MAQLLLSMEDAQGGTFEANPREVLKRVLQRYAARGLKPIDERALPFGKTVMLFDGADPAQLAQLGDTRTPGLADLFVATMKGTYA